MRRGLTLRLSETGQDRFRRARVQDLPGANIKWGQGTFVTFVCLHLFIWSSLRGDVLLLLLYFGFFFLFFSFLQSLNVYHPFFSEISARVSLPHSPSPLSLYPYPPPFVLDNIFLIY